jgi:zinc D-Ala-D-Ala carboxypeptidase
MIDWTNLTDKVSNHFTVKECLWLPQWHRLANEADGLTDDIKNNLINLCDAMDTVRDYFGAPINVHCMLRPPAYNTLVKGAKSSAHLIGQACDFDVSGMSCKDAQDKILADGKLVIWLMRMEDNTKGGTVLPTWLHLDLRIPPTGNRFFIP